MQLDSAVTTASKVDVTRICTLQIGHFLALWAHSEHMTA